MAFSPQASLNCSALMPATSANSASFGEPVCTMVSKFLSRVDIALPPASASMPTEDSAVATAIISASDSPMMAPDDASRVPMATMSASVVAKLLPRSTMVAPSRL